MKNLTLILTTSLSIVSFPAFSAGEGSTPLKTETTQECEDGQIWDEKTEECVDPEESSTLDDDIIYKNAREFAYFGDLDDAMRLLNLAENPNDPRILTYKGFVSRKSGKLEESFAFYEKALEIDPKYDLARSYYGQGLWKNGQNKEAKEQLAMIKQNSGTKSDAYKALRKTIKGYNSSY